MGKTRKTSTSNDDDDATKAKILKKDPTTVKRKDKMSTARNDRGKHTRALLSSLTKLSY